MKMKKGVQKKRVGVHPLVTALSRAGPVPADLVLSLRLQELSAIEALAKGNASAVDLQMMRELLRMCARSMEAGIGPEAEPTCEVAYDILANCRIDPSVGYTVRMNEDQIAVMRDLQGFHDLQRSACTWGSYLRLTGANSTSSQR